MQQSVSGKNVVLQLAFAATMGFILNRSIIISIITYVGVIIGYLNVLWLYPKVLEIEEIGLFRFLQDIAMLFVPFAQLGAGQGLIRYFPHGTTKAEQKQIITMSLLWALFSFAVFLIFFWLLQDLIHLAFAENAGAVNEYLPVVLLLTFILSIQGVFESLSRSLLKFRFVAFCTQILLRVLSAVLVLLYFFKFLSLTDAIWGLVVVYGTITLIIAIYLIRSDLTGFSLSFSPTIKKLFNPFIRYGLITFLSSASSLLIMKTDTWMVTQMIGLTATGIYTTVFFMAVVVEMPRRIISQISTPLLSQSFEQNNLALAQKIYQKSSINLLLVGALLYIGIICNMASLFSLMPQGETFRAGAWVVILIGMGKLIDGAAGVNGEILVMSKYYRINLYLTILLAIVNIALNYLLIPPFGIEGAALGSCLSLVIFNLLKYLYIWFKLKLQPFSLKTLWLLIILSLAFVVGWFLPHMFNPLADIVVRSLIITGIVAIGVLWLKVSDEASSLYLKLYSYLIK